MYNFEDFLSFKDDLIIHTIQIKYKLKNLFVISNYQDLH